MRIRMGRAPLGLAAGAALLLMLSGCAYYDYYDPYYGGYYRPYYSGYYRPYYGYHSGYYDGHYGPFIGGYWAGDGTFAYRDRYRRYYRDYGRHFRRHSFPGGRPFRYRGY